MSRFWLIFMLLVAAGSASAQSVVISNSVKLVSGNAGEAQSTVVPPNKNMEKCKEGRVLITNDSLRPPNGVVFGQKLDQPGGAVIPSTFDMGSIGANYDADFTKSSYW